MNVINITITGYREDKEEIRAILKEIDSRKSFSAFVMKSALEKARQLKQEFLNANLNK